MTTHYVFFLDFQAECCWKQESSCATESGCSSYTTSCANLVARLDGNISSTGTDTTAFIPEAPSDIDKTCDPSNVATFNGYKDCNAACGSAECCWKSGASDSCVSDSDCRAWSPCTVMNGASEPQTSGTTESTGDPTAQDYTLEQVFDACLNHDNNVGSTHKSLCQIVCQAGNCCFDDANECPSGFDCKTFDPCQVLHSETSSKVEAACDGSDLAECVGICAEATCCFTNDIAKICDVTNPNVICRQYKACEVLYKAEASNP